MKQIYIIITIKWMLGCLVCMKLMYSTNSFFFYILVFDFTTLFLKSIALTSYTIYNSPYLDYCMSFLHLAVSKNWCTISVSDVAEYCFLLCLSTFYTFRFMQILRIKVYTIYLMNSTVSWRVLINAKSLANHEV